MSIVELPSRWPERSISAEDWKRYERYVGEIFSAFGMDLGTPGTVETPRRFLRALYDATAGYDGDEKLRPCPVQLANRFDVGAVAFGHTIGNMDEGFAAERGQMRGNRSFQVDAGVIGSDRDAHHDTLTRAVRAT